MPVVQAAVEIPQVSLSQTWATVSDIARFPAIADHVLDVQPVDGDERTTSWRVLLNGSQVDWVQRDTSEPPTRQRFELVTGDLEQLRGGWTLTPSQDGVRLALDIAFELGVDGLAPLLEPSWTQSFQAYADLLVRAVARTATRSTR